METKNIFKENKLKSKNIIKIDENEVGIIE